MLPVEWLELLKWLLPSGCIVTLCGYILRRRVNQAQRRREVESIYKTMYEETKKSMLDLMKEIKQLKEEQTKRDEENRKLYRAISRLERAVSLVSTCQHYDDCPVKHELYRQKSNDKQRIVRQSKDKRIITTGADRDTAVKGDPVDTPGNPAGAV